MASDAHVANPVTEQVFEDQAILINTIRQHIRVREIIETLENHIIHGTEMTSTQVNAALALLKKVLPDIPAGAGKSPASEAEKMTHEDWLEILD